MRWLYELMYRLSLVPWDSGPRNELIEFITTSGIEPCRTIYLGSGTASNAIYMAQQGFDVLGLDFSAEAVKMGRTRALEAGVDIEFVQDDLTNLQHVHEQFDLLVDFGTFDDLGLEGRKRYAENILSLTHDETVFFMWCWEWPLRWWERWANASPAVEPGEVQQLFSHNFDIDRIAGSETHNYKKFPPGHATYLMKRK